MTVKELQRIAKTMGIRFLGLKKTELVKTIQRAEGNFDCFGTAINCCDQPNCLFRNDCLPPGRLSH